MRSRPILRRDFLKTLPLAAAGFALPARTAPVLPPGKNKRLPNIVLILSDDVGYGDLGSYGAGVVKTPNLDQLARQGLRFTDAHSDAATCTPSRYAILTGAYAWRKPGVQILAGDAPLLIDPSQPTISSLLKQAGYFTGCVGKWHVGLGNGAIDWNGRIQPGPREVGFDYSFIIPATPDRVPCVYVENHHVVNLDPKDPIRVSYKGKVGDDPTGREDPQLLKMQLSHGHDGTIVDGVSRMGYMSGGNSARWVDEVMEQTLTAKAVSFIEEHRSQPFFLYFATSDIHVPHVPNREFAHRSACGLRCDAIDQLDWSVGRIMSTLERLHLTDDTWVVFTSDNGPVVDDGYADGSVQQLNGHTPAGDLRGGKYSIYEGGTRVPLISHWPGHIRPGVSDALVGQVDLMASFAALAGVTSPPGPDSKDLLPALLGKSRTGRDSLVEESDVLAIREGDWKLIDRQQRPGRNARAKRSAGAPDFELYDLSHDIQEKQNLAATDPAEVRRLAGLLEQIRNSGHS